MFSGGIERNQQLKISSLHCRSLNLPFKEEDALGYYQTTATKRKSFPAVNRLYHTGNNRKPNAFWFSGFFKEYKMGTLIRSGSRLLVRSRFCIVHFERTIACLL